MATIPKVTSGPATAFDAPPSAFGSLTLFPREVLLHIINCLDFRNLMAASLVNHDWMTLAEDTSTVLGKVKSAFRVVNGQCQIEVLSPSDQSYRAVWNAAANEMEYFLSKKENGTVTRLKITEPKTQLRRSVLQDPSVSHFWVSKTLFVSKVGVNFYSNQINYANMTIVSSDMTAFPAPLDEQHETTGFWQNQEFLEVGIKTSTALHALQYLIDEKSGPAKFYLGELKHHIVCQMTRRNDANPPYEELTSIAKIEKEEGLEIMKWSQPQNNDRLISLALDREWLILVCGATLSQLRYHFINVNSGEEKYTYALKAVPSLGQLLVYPVTLKENICLIAYSITTRQGFFPTAKMLELEARQSIPLSYNANQVLSGSLITSGDEIKFECDWTQEDGFLKIEGSDIIGRDYRIKFSGNPTVRSTSFSPNPSLYDRFVNFMHSIRSKFTRLVIFYPVAYIVIILIFPFLCLLFLYAMLRNLKK